MSTTLELRKNWLVKNWFILSSLVAREFKLKYRRSFLGVAWSVLNPLLMMIVMTLVFSTIFRFDIPNYAAYLILGQVFFNFMTASTTAGMNSILASASLIKKVKIEKAMFPLKSVISELVNLAFSMIAVVLVLIFTRVQPRWTWFLIPFPLLCLLLFALGIALALSALEVFFRDVSHLWSVFTLAWMYATPIFYPITIFDREGRAAAFMKTVMPFNPMYQFIDYLRRIVLDGVVPSGGAHLACLAAAAVTLALGLLVFRATERRFILYV